MEKKKVLYRSIIIIIILYIPFLYTPAFNQVTGNIQAKGSVIDFSTMIPENKIYLSGEWSFFYKHLLVSEPDQTVKPDALIKVPDFWTHNKVNGKYLPLEGYASYLLTMEGLESNQPVSAYVPDLGGSYRVYIDGRLASESGVVSKVQSLNSFSSQDAIYPVVLSHGSQHEMIIEISTNNSPGLYMAPVWGEYNKLMRDKEIRSNVRLIMMSIAAFSLLRILVMTLISGKKPQNGYWIPLASIYVLLRIILTSDWFFVWKTLLFLDLSYEYIHVFLVFLSFCFKYEILSFSQKMLGIKLEKMEKAAILVFFSFIFGMYLYAHKGVVSPLFSLFAVVFATLINLFLVYTIYNKKEEFDHGDRLVLYGIITLVFGMTVDNFYMNGVILKDMSLYIFGIFAVFMILMSLVYALRNRELMNQHLNFAVRLETANNLLQIQREHYAVLKNQMNEIRSIKHDNRHVLGVIGRLAEEGKIAELRELITEYTGKTESVNVPLFCENDVANSMLGYYFTQAKMKDIPVRINCVIEDIHRVSDIDLCILLGNGMENAIEACMRMSMSDPKFISVEAKTVKDHWMLKICNSYYGSLNAAEGGYISSKTGNSHGFGILNIEKVSAAYQGYVKTDHDDHMFTLMVAIPTGKEE